MTKKLNEEQTKNINGGAIETDPTKLVWQYDLGATLTVDNDKNSWESYKGKVTKLGYCKALIFYAPYYYVDCGNANFDGWYSEEDIAATLTNNARRVNAENSKNVVVVKE